MKVSGACNDNSCLKEREIVEPVMLCDSRGFLNQSAVGWARKPIYDCNLKGHWNRKKKWNYWLIVSDRNLFSVTISNIDYAGLVFAYFYDFKSGLFIEKTIMLTPYNACKMPNNVGEGMEYKDKEASVAFAEEGGKTKIHLEMKEFGGKNLKAEFTIAHPEDHETLNVVIPWNQKTFQFTSKQNCLPAQGKVWLNNVEYLFKSSSTMASLDFGRGVWPRKSFWNWATCSGINDGRAVGVNLGGGWTDGTGMTENAVIVGSKISKINERMIFTYDVNDLMKPWRIKTENTDRVELEFKPVYKRLARSNIVVVSSNIYQMFGYFSGSIVTDEGERVNINNIFGCAEEHKAKW